MIFKEGISSEGLDADFITDIEFAERVAGLSFYITSAYRDGDPKCHGVGRAVDISCEDSTSRFAIVRGLTIAGFRRIGLYDRHIHADRCTDRPVRVLWMGESK